MTEFTGLERPAATGRVCVPLAEANPRTRRATAAMRRDVPGHRLASATNFPLPPHANETGDGVATAVSQEASQ